jgi:hypothetical protein
MIERTIQGIVEKVEITKEGGVAYLKLEPKDLSSRLFEALSGGPTLGFRVTDTEARSLHVGNRATVVVKVEPSASVRVK